MARIDLVDEADFPDAERHLLQVLSPREGLPAEYEHLIDGSTRNVYRMLGVNEPVLRAFREYTSDVWAESGLSLRERELAILAIAVALENDYEWHQHVRVALKEGLEPAEIEAIAAGDLDGFPPAERALLAYVPAFLDGEVDDDTHDALAEHYDDGTIVGIGALVGVYRTIAGMVEAYDVPVEEDFVGWDLEGV